MGRRGPQAAHQAVVGDAGTRIKCPEHMDAASAAIWRQFVPLILKSGILKRVDGQILESFCTYRALWLSYMKALGSLTVGSIEYSRVSQLANSAHVQLLKVTAELGLTPNSRARLKMETIETEPDELNEFLRR